MKNNLGLTVNNGSSPNILDDWITDAVVGILGSRVEFAERFNVVQRVQSSPSV